MSCIQGRSSLISSLQSYRPKRICTQLPRAGKMAIRMMVCDCRLQSLWTLWSAISPLKTVHGKNKTHIEVMWLICIIHRGCVLINRAWLRNTHPYLTQNSRSLNNSINRHITCGSNITSTFSFPLWLTSPIPLLKRDRFNAPPDMLTWNVETGS